MAILKYKTNQTLIDGGFNQVSGQTLSLSGNTLIGSTGTLRYSSDQSGTYVARSVVDAGYVTGKTSPIGNVGSVGQVIYRGIDRISGATGFLYDSVTSGVTVNNLSISSCPTTDVCNDWLLSWDNVTGEVHKICYSTSVGLTSACNGLSVIGSDAILGGLLTQDTIINGSGSFSLRNENLCGMCITTTANNIVLDSRNNTGGIYLKSQCGAISSPITNFGSSVGIAMDYPSNLFKIYDNRLGAEQKGIEYAGNYNAFFTPRSLVDKTYVDAVASGLQPHPAVLVATTGNTALSGLTSGTTYIDTILIDNGDRVLIKN